MCIQEVKITKVVEIHIYGYIAINCLNVTKPYWFSLLLWPTDMASGPAAFASSPRENTKYARLCRLLIDMGTKALRNVFDAIHSPANLHKILSSSSPHFTTLKWLQKKGALNPTLWGKLSTLSTAEFDITILMVLLRNVCDLSPPVSTSNWDELPPDFDNSTEANIVRIKKWCLCSCQQGFSWWFDI